MAGPPDSQAPSVGAAPSLAEALVQAADQARGQAAESACARAWQAHRHRAAVMAGALPDAVTVRVMGLAGQGSPVIVVGGDDSTRELVALALHFEGPRAEGPLLLMAATRPAAAWDDAVRGAEGGTLYIDEAEALDRDARRRLAQAAALSAETRLVVGSGRMPAVTALTELLPGGPAAAALVALPESGGEAATSSERTLRDMMARYEARILREALRAHGGNKTRAADALGITREGLHKKLGKHGL